MNYLFFSFMNYLFFSSSRSLLSPSQSSPLPPPSPRSRFHSKRASTNPIPRLRWQAAVAAFSYAMQRERADFSPEPRGPPFRRPPPGRRHWSDFSSLDSAHAGRLCARTGLHEGQKCIYCNGPYGATCILWPCGGGAACFDCTDKARSGGLEALDRVRADRWLKSLSWSRTSKWRDVIALADVGNLVAPYMIHLHQNRGNVWLRQVGWTNLYPSRDPAPEWRAAVAAQSNSQWRLWAKLCSGRHCDDGVTLDEGVHSVCQVVEAAKAMAEGAVANLPPRVDIRHHGGPAGDNRGTLRRTAVMEGMSCRLLLLDVRGPTLLLADRSGPRNGSMLLLVDSAGATAADRDEANRIRFCTAAVAGAVEKIESSEPRSSVRAAYAPTPSPVPGDIRTFELNVAIVLEHANRQATLDQASRLQRRIREIAMHWAFGQPDPDRETALLEEIYNAEQEIQRLAGVAPWPHPDQRRALVAGGADAASDALAAYALLRERQGRRRAVADAVGAVAAAQRAAQGAAGAAGMPRAAAEVIADAAVAAFTRHQPLSPIAIRRTQRERVRPISISESSEERG